MSATPMSVQSDTKEQKQEAQRERVAEQQETKRVKNEAKRARIEAREKEVTENRAVKAAKKLVNKHENAQKQLENQERKLEKKKRHAEVENEQKNQKQAKMQAKNASKISIAIDLKDIMTKAMQKYGEVENVVQTVYGVSVTFKDAAAVLKMESASKLPNGTVQSAWEAQISSYRYALSFPTALATADDDAALQGKLETLFGATLRAAELKDGYITVGFTDSAGMAAALSAITSQTLTFNGQLITNAHEGRRPTSRKRKAETATPMVE